MVKHSRVNDPSGFIITDRINNNFGFLSVDPPELTVTSNTIDLSEASVTSNIYSIDSASSEIVDTIVGGVVGQQITIVNSSTANTVTFNGTGGNIKGLTGSAILDGQYSNIVLGKLDTTNWGVVSSSGNIILENIFGVSYGNGKDGNAAASDFTAVTGGRLMGGEYWFNEFEIDDDIIVDASIGWLVIRANIVTISKSGGALIDGAGKSPVYISPYDWSTYIPAAIAPLFANGDYYGTEIIANFLAGAQVPVQNSLFNRNIASMYNALAGQGGSGAIIPGSSRTYSNPVPVLYSLNGRYVNMTLGRKPDVSGVYLNGVSGADGVNIDTFYANLFIKNCVGFGQSGNCGSDGLGNYSGTYSAPATPGAGGRGGANVCLFAKNIVLSNSLDVDCSGDDGEDSTETIYISALGKRYSGGAGGGGAAGNFLLAYITKSGASSVTSTVLGGAGGTAAVTDTTGGDGGDGGDGLTVIIDDFAKTIDINGSGMLPA